MSNNQRNIDQVITPDSTSDGGGVKLKRSLGGKKLDNLDPFLLLDEFKSEDSQDYIAGFPDHPHRGFETVTYMLSGRMEHRDHKGNCGNLVPGSVQWMTAGRGIVHSEMPKQDTGLIWGFQLWVNLPANKKMIDPRYQDIPPERIPVVDVDDMRIKVLAGESYGTVGPVEGIVTHPLYIDVSMPPNKHFHQKTPDIQNTFIYVFEGTIKIDDREVSAPKLITFKVDKGKDEITVNTLNSNGRFLLVSGDPIGEPIARAGPFVMNTREELYQAYMDFQTGKLQQ